MNRVVINGKDITGRVSYVGIRTDHICLELGYKQPSWFPEWSPLMGGVPHGSNCITYSILRDDKRQVGQ